MTVRAKYRLTGILTSQSAPGAIEYKKLIFSPMYDASIPEDQRFLKGTPIGGQIEMHVDNPAALAQFTMASDWYLDFTPVPK